VLLFPFNHRGLICIQNADNDLWEANRTVTSGVATRKGVDLDFENESQSAVHVMVHNLKPLFLGGRTVFTKQLDPIDPIRDLTSDMAMFAKKVSALEVRSLSFIITH
jgi:pre-mRNA-splicing factor ATP-dependent RNA helicase DHX38/PRP16